MSTRAQEPQPVSRTAKPARRIPSEEGIWVFVFVVLVFIDLAIFP